MSGASGLPADDPRRDLLIVQVDDQALPHVGVVGDTCTVLVPGSSTDGAYTLIDMRIPPGGGPGPHRHDFEELFVVQQGAVRFTFRDEERVVGAGRVVNVPANAPHHFSNDGDEYVRMLCMCTPAAQEELFLAIGEPLPRSDSAATHLDGDAFAPWLAHAATLAPGYRTEMLLPPGTSPDHRSEQP